MRYPEYQRHVPSNSSVVVYVSHYDSDKMNVKFKNGSLYTFYGVSKNRYTRLCRAESLGSYFSKHVRGQYTSRKRDFAFERSVNAALLSKGA